MTQILFPVSGQRVVPLVKIDDDELTSVQTRKSSSCEADLKIKIIRLVIGSFFKATVVKIEPENCVVRRAKRE